MRTTTIRIDDRVLDQLDSMAKNLSRSRTWVINQAIERYLSYEEWFVYEVKTGLNEIQRDDFASPEEVKARFGKLGVNAD